MKPDPESLETPFLASCPPSVRAGFLRRVYILLALQLLATTGVVAVMCAQPVVREWVVVHPEMALVGAFGGLACICPFASLKDRHPWNVLLFVGFTVCEAYVVGHVCAAYATVGMGHLIASSLGVTVAIFTGLSVYVHVSGRDFGWLGPTLFVACLALLAVGLIGVFVQATMLQMMIAVGGVVVFSGFVLYDTSNMLSRMTPDDALLASVELYLDIINLFFYTLQLLQTCQNDS